MSEEEKDPPVKASVYMSPEKYEELKRQRREKTTSNFFKTLIMFAYGFLIKPYDLSDALTFARGGIPDRDEVKFEAERMSTGQLRDALTAVKEVERLVGIRKEVIEEVLRRRD